MKKILTFVLCLVLLFALAIPAWAEGEEAAEVEICPICFEDLSEGEHGEDVCEHTHEWTAAWGKPYCYAVLICSDCDARAPYPVHPCW